MDSSDEAQEQTLDQLAGQVETDPSRQIDRVQQALLPSGAPADPERMDQFFELYKLMVGTSESLVARRQGTNTFFLTINGLILSAVGLFIHQGVDIRSHALVVVVFCLTGLIISWSWRTLLTSFGQLNKGKFAVILRMEKSLAASIFDAEWEALDRGDNKKTYRSFTQNESRIPIVFSAIYILAAVIALLISLGWFPKV